MLYLLLTTVMTKQLDAAVWILDSNELASFQHGDFLLHYCEPKPCSIVLQDVSKVTRKFEISLVCFQLTLTYLSTVQLFCCFSVLFFLTRCCSKSLHSSSLSFLSFFLFLQTILSLPLSSVPPQVVLSTEHCIVPCYLFLKASSLLGACDIRGLTEHQPVAIGEDIASLAGREAQCRCLPPSVCLLGHNSRAWSEHERLGLGERGSSRNDGNIGFRLTEKK